MEEHNQPNNKEQANANKTLPENVLLEKENIGQEFSKTVLSEQQKNINEAFFYILVLLSISYLGIRLVAFLFHTHQKIAITLFIITILCIFISYFRRENKPYSQNITQKLPIFTISMIMWLLFVPVSFKFLFTDKQQGYGFILFIATFFCIYIPEKIYKKKKINIFLLVMQGIYTSLFLFLLFIIWFISNICFVCGR